MYRKNLFITSLGVLLIVVVLSLPLACSHTNNSSIHSNSTITTNISIEEATSILNQTIEYAVNHNFDGLCSMGGAASMCRTLWESAGGWDAVPTQYPEIIDSYTLQTKACENGNYITGGRILVLKGIDGTGKPYQTDFFVFNNSETGLLSVQYPVYWGNFSVRQTDCNGSAYASVP